ncbi:unnamed protein product, partial [Brachionus calyciflorus]
MKLSSPVLYSNQILPVCIPTRKRRNRKKKY